MFFFFFFAFFRVLASARLVSRVGLLLDGWRCFTPLFPFGWWCLSNLLLSGGAACFPTRKQSLFLIRFSKL